MRGHYNADVRGPGYELHGTANTRKWGWFVGEVQKGKDSQDLYIDEDTGTPTVIHVGITSLTNAHNFDGARLNKWEMDETATYKYGENDAPLFRYPEILWNKIEAIKRGGQGNVADVTSLPAFKTLMKRSFAYSTNPEQAFIDAYGDPASWSLDQILDERGREFSWEMIRRRDLIRYDKFSSIQYVKAKEPVRKWFPIPFSVLEKSLLDENGNKIWTQTPGYENL